MNKTIIALVMLSLPLAAVAQEKDAPAATNTPAAGPVVGQSAASQEAMMQAWKDFATPNENHKRLAALVGSWKTHTKWWVKPGGAPAESDGTADIKSVLGGRYIEQLHEGKMMGQPFSGIGYTGFDNIKQRYITTWMDNMGTSILYVTGKADPSGQVIKSQGTVDDPLTKKPQKYQDAVTLNGPDKFTYEAWGPEPGGAKMFRMMEIVYTRAK